MITSLLLTSAGIVAVPAAPEVLDNYTPARLFESLTEYEEQTRWDPPDVPIRQWPEGLEKGARYGVVNIGLQRRVYILTAWPHTVIVDLDGDGNLGDEQRLPLGPETWGKQEALSVTLTGDRPGLPIKLSFPLLDGEVTGEVFQHLWTVRRGDVRLGERTLAFALQGFCGVYSDLHNAVYFDLDGDGELSIRDDQSPERFPVEEGRVNLDGRGYAFTVDPIGDSLTLTPIDEWVPARSALTLGSPASSFRFVDLDLVPGSLEEYRGRVVLLYFYYVGCPPCRKMLPVLADLNDAFHESGLEILAVNTSDSLEIIREYVASQEFPGRQVPDGDDGPIKKLYRVHGVPTWFVIDREGRIAGRSDHASSFSPVEDVRELFKATAP